MALEQMKAFNDLNNDKSVITVRVFKGLATIILGRIKFMAKISVL